MVDYSPIVNQVFKLWAIIPVILVLGLFKTAWFKGLIGEFVVKLTAKLRLPSNTYFPFHNVTLPTADSSTQIDHIFVSEFGIFVVETKNMKGWIFGGEKQRQWTQKIYKKSFRFQNPLHQNYKHVKTLGELLNVSSEAIHSVIVFVGDCRLKSPFPSNVAKGGEYVSFIKSFSEPVLTQTEVQNVISQIQEGRLEPSRATHQKHVEHLNARSNMSADRTCVKCGEKMVLRTAKRGTNSGKQFWGCTAFPKCKAIQPLA